MKKSIEQLALFYSGGASLIDSPWRGTTANNGPEYLDAVSIAQVARERGIVGRVANPILREIGIGESSHRVMRKELPE